MNPFFMPWQILILVGMLCLLPTTLAAIILCRCWWCVFKLWAGYTATMWCFVQFLILLRST